MPKGRTAEQETPLSKFLHLFKETVDAPKSDIFTQEVFENFVENSDGYDPESLIKGKYNLRRLATYYSGHNPDKAFISGVYHCERPQKFAAWIRATYPTFLDQLAFIFYFLDRTKKIDRTNIPEVMSEALVRAFLALQCPSANISLSKSEFDSNDEDPTSLGYKSKYGRALLRESDSRCEVCGSDLISQNGFSVFRVVAISREPNAPDDISNLVPVCEKDFAMLGTMDEVDRSALLKESKQLWSNEFELKKVANDAHLSDKIKDLLDTIENVGVADASELQKEVDLKYDPSSVSSKLRDEMRFCGLVNYLASSDFETIRKSLKDISSFPGNNKLAQTIASQMRTTYLELAEINKRSKETIFMVMTNNLAKRTQKSWVLCAAFVSYCSSQR